MAVSLDRFINGLTFIENQLKISDFDKFDDIELMKQEMELISVIV